MTSPPSSICTMCGSEVDTSLLGGVCPRCLLGDIISGPEDAKAGEFDGHELLVEIARGGMGVVYRARQLEPDRLVALKTLRSASLDSPEAMARFKHEAEVMVALDHAAILPVYHCGEMDGIPFFTMKLVEGGSLADSIGRYSGNWRGIAELMLRVCDGVQHAHERGVLHRDLKPGNILFDATGQSYVSDFGIAKLEDTQDAAMTMTMSMIGTPHYLAPEIAAGSAKAASVSSDVWSLGVILYELLTGEKPFKGESLTQLVRALELEQAIAPRKLRADVPRDLEVITLKALSRDPARRYSSVQALGEDLRAWLGGRPITARAVPLHERAWMWARRNPGLCAALMMLALTLVGAAAALVWGFVRVKQENSRVVASQTNERARLRESLLSQAHAGRVAHEMGWRAAGLKALREAHAIRPGDDVRDEAIAHLAGFDLEFGGRRFNGQVHPSRSMEYYVQQLTIDAKYHFIVRRMQDDAELFRLPWVSDIGVVHVEFDPHGRWLAVSVSGREARVYSMEDRRELARWPGAVVLRATEDGKLLPVQQSDRWVMWHTTDWSIAEDIPKSPLVLDSRSFQPQPQPGIQSLLVTRCARGLDVVDWRTRAKLRHVEFISQPVTYAWLGDYLVGDCPNDLTQIFDLRRGHSIMLPQIATHGFVFLSSDSAYLLCSAPVGFGTVVTQIWHLPTGAKLGKGRGISVKQLGPDDRRLIGQDSQGYVEGRVVRPSCLRLLPDRQMSGVIRSSSKSIDLSPDGKLLAIRDRSKVAVHDVATGRLLARLEMDGALFFAFSPDGRELWLANAKGIKFFKMECRDAKLTFVPEREVLLPESGPPTSIFLNPHDAAVVARMTASNAVYEWRKDSAQWHPWNGPSFLKGSLLSFSRDGRWIAGVSGGVWTVCDASASSVRRGIEESRERNGRMTFSPDSRHLVYLDSDFRWDVYEAPDWDHVASSGSSPSADRTNAYNSSLEVAWSPDASWFAVVSDGTDIHLVEAGTWQIMARLHGPLEMPISGVLITADGSHLVVQRRDGPVEIWDFRKLEGEMRALGMNLRLPPVATPPPTPTELQGPFDELKLPPLIIQQERDVR